MQVAEDGLAALRMTGAEIIAGRRRERVWRWKSRRAERLASRVIRGATTKEGSGWTTDAGLTSGWNLNGQGRRLPGIRLCAARRMMAGDITATRTRVEMWT